VHLDTFDAFRSLYESAYHQGVKGCTAFRPTKLREGILLSAEMGAHCCSIEQEED
jgi:ribonucleoside-diphosphate reductase alpha chain